MGLRSSFKTFFPEEERRLATTDPLTGGQPARFLEQMEMELGVRRFGTLAASDVDDHQKINTPMAMPLAMRLQHLAGFRGPPDSTCLRLGGERTLPRWNRHRTGVATVITRNIPFQSALG